MTPADLERAAALYLPLCVAAVAWLLRGRQSRQFAATLLSLLWTLPALLIMQRLNQRFAWWMFPSGSEALLRGMPLELYLGWAILWGIVPQLAFPRLALPLAATTMLLVDLIAMPLTSAAIHLNVSWLVGEAVAFVFVLFPALAIARCTLTNTHLFARALLQIATAGLLFLYLIPELIFALRPGPNWQPLFALSSPVRQLALQGIFMLALPGITAVLEFAERGNGTPIPYDPPQRLVTSGIYRYIANPMQFSCAIVMLAWALLLRSGWMLLAACVSIAYSAGLAEWDEAQDLAQRFGMRWKIYRAHVRNWLPRWRPHHGGAGAILYIAQSCGPCTQVREWIEARKPLGLYIVAAESLPSGTISRMRYDPHDGTPYVEGVRAMGRALEHLNLAWALCGAALRLPILWRVIQLFMDASGLGPRVLTPAHPLPRLLLPDAHSYIRPSQVKPVPPRP